MAEPLSADRLLAAVKTISFPVHTYDGWRTNKVRGGFTPAGVCVHITAGGLGGRSVESYIRDILLKPYLKCQFAIAPDGSVWVLSANKAAHALLISDAAIAAYRHGLWPVRPGYETRWKGSRQAGNDWSYGIEMIAGSGSKVTAAQRSAAVQVCAALCRALGRTAGSVAGHGEQALDRATGPSGDPGIDMGRFRMDVAALLRPGGGSAPAPKPVPKPNPKPAPTPDWEDEIMAMTPAQRAQLIDDIATAVLSRRYRDYDADRTPRTIADFIVRTESGVQRQALERPIVPVRGTDGTTHLWTVPHALDWIIRKLDQVETKINKG